MCSKSDGISHKHASTYRPVSHQVHVVDKRNISTISRHINNAFEEGELKKEEVIAFFANTTQHGAVDGGAVWVDNDAAKTIEIHQLMEIFYDSHHLSDIGASKFSKIVKEECVGARK